MKRSEILSKYTLTVLNKRNISDEFIQQFTTIDELRKGLHNLQKLEWAKNNREYFKEFYDKKMRPHFQKKYQENKDKLKEQYNKRSSIIKLFKILPFHTLIT